MYYPSHISATQAPAPQSVTAGGMGHYSHHQPPPVMQPGPGQYPSAQSSYAQYGYNNGLTSPQQGHQLSGPMGPQGNVPLLPPMTSQQSVMPGQAYPQQQGFDTTGQVAPAGMKPRVTATLWEDEGSLCFQVEAKGICVARREG
jgi:protein SOK2